MPRGPRPLAGPRPAPDCRPARGIRRGGLLPLPPLDAPFDATSAAEKRAVGPSGRKQYDEFFTMLEVWARRAGRPPLRADSQLDATVAHLVSALMLDGAPAADGEKVVAAVKDRFPQTAGSHNELLARSARALRGFRKARPATSRFPMPRDITHANIVTMLAWGEKEAALETWLSDEAYLRPCEARGLRIKDLNSPIEGGSPALQAWSITLAPSEVLEPSKTQTFDDTIRLEFTPRLGESLAALGKGRPATAPLFAADPEAFRRCWQAAQRSLGLEKTCLYQLRHGGASDDAMTSRRDSLAILVRGRWSSFKTLKRYMKPGLVQATLNRLSSPDRAYVAWCRTHFDAILDGLVLPALPPSLGGPVPEATVTAPPRARLGRALRKRPAASQQAERCLRRRPAAA